jgi:hypothetical protein
LGFFEAISRKAGRNPFMNSQGSGSTAVQHLTAIGAKPTFRMALHNRAAFNA